MENENIKKTKKEYNSEYYAKNKNKILSDLCTPIQCEFCDRTVIKNNLLKHYDSKICKKFTYLKRMRKSRMNV
jgi:hypothetical protein